VEVESVMTRDVVAVRRDTSLREVARILSEHRISGMPVLDDAGVVCGVLSSADLLPKEYVHEPPARRFHFRAAKIDARVEARTAGEAMTAPAVCIFADRPIWEAASLMLRHRVNRLPVAGRDGELVGIVTRADLVRAFTRLDYELENDLHDAFEHEGVDVEIARGEVILRGVVASRATAAELVERATRVPGVVGVKSRLMWPDNGKVPAALSFLS
jgi:CBS domain-containing protein